MRFFILIFPFTAFACRHSGLEKPASDAAHTLPAVENNKRLIAPQIDSAFTPTKASIGSWKKRAVAENADPENPDADEDDLPLTNRRIDEQLQASSMQILFDDKADINEDGFADRLVILDDSLFRLHPKENSTGRQLRLYYGQADNTFNIGLYSDNAIPPYESRQMAAKETELHNIRISKGRFSFEWISENYFTHKYHFIYNRNLQTLKLAEMYIDERAERFSQDEIQNLHLTEHDFGQRPIDFFNAAKFQLWGLGRKSN